MKKMFLGMKDIFALANGEPIIESLLDTDYYKFPMAYFIWQNPEYRNTEVTFKLIVRDKRIKVMKTIPESALREQLCECRKLRLSQAESSFVGGMTLGDNQTHIIPGDFLHALREEMRLPPYHLELTEEGDLVLWFWGKWWMVTWWEIMAMAIVSELYYYFFIKSSNLSEFEISSIYAKMIIKLHDKIALFKQHPEVNFALFDTRRRHSRYMQEFVMNIMRKELPKQCRGTSSVLLSMMHGSANPIGTKAHELPMVKACLAGDDVGKIKASQYDIELEWLDLFGPEMSILLPDTFGTVQFLRDAPRRLAVECRGTRPDSMEQTEATDIHVEWWKRHGVDPRTRLVLPSDGLDVGDMIDGTGKNASKVGSYSFGWGTLAGNDCRDVWPRRNDPLAQLFRPFSMACKVVEADGVGAVKLSDNPSKATGPEERVEMFKRIFGTAGSMDREVIV